jgi:phosphatidylinositol alpha-1,6-mannosyltransferase
MSENISLITLQTFSTTGGIQKMTRTLGHSLYTISKQNNRDFKMISLYDTDGDLMPQYLPKANFKGFGAGRVNFLLSTLFIKRADIIILSHINLAIVGLVMKLLHPKSKIWLIAHGIEVWRPLSYPKRLLLKWCSKILCVSNYTKAQMLQLHHTATEVCHVLNNALDPFMKLPVSFSKPKYLLNRYYLTGSGPVIFTLTRLASTEFFKGHDRVIKAVSALKSSFPNIRYILSGKYDEAEEARLKSLITSLGVGQQVILTGFIDEHELTDHFLLADVFVLPSKKEGFGIVFIEALACGLPVICGNADGSIDAIRNGELGLAVDTDDQDELNNAIIKNLQTPLTDDKRRQLQAKCLEYFNEAQYINKLELLINEWGNGREVGY